jgi:hypothetical protein
LADAATFGQRRAWIEVNDRNKASLRGIKKAGFVEAATLEGMVWFSRWVTNPRRSISEPRFGRLFATFGPDWPTIERPSAPGVTCDVLAPRGL